MADESDADLERVKAYQEGVFPRVRARIEERARDLSSADPAIRKRAMLAFERVAIVLQNDPAKLIGFSVVDEPMLHAPDQVAGSWGARGRVPKPAASRRAVR